MLQSMLIGVLVAWAVLHAALHLLPPTWRGALAAKVRARALSALGPRALHWRLCQRVLAAPAGECADCGGRSRCAAQPRTQAQPYGGTLIARSRG